VIGNLTKTERSTSRAHSVSAHPRAQSAVSTFPLGGVPWCYSTKRSDDVGVSDVATVNGVVDAGQGTLDSTVQRNHSKTIRRVNLTAYLRGMWRRGVLPYRNTHATREVTLKPRGPLWVIRVVSAMSAVCPVYHREPTS
jgi:hypothetical protein